MAEQQKFTVKVSKQHNEETRLALGLEIVDFIVNRTQSGKDKNDNDFTGSYSKSYLKSLDFKNAGKGGLINLTLSGEMLNSITVLESTEGEITIGIPEDDDFNNAKAEGNIKGTYGGSAKKGKQRDFMGISKEKLNELKDKYPVKTKADRDSTSLLSKDLLLSTEASAALADSFLGKNAFDEVT